MVIDVSAQSGWLPRQPLESCQRVSVVPPHRTLTVTMKLPLMPCFREQVFFRCLSFGSNRA